VTHYVTSISVRDMTLSCEIGEITLADVSAFFCIAW